MIYRERGEGTMGRIWGRREDQNGFLGKEGGGGDSEKIVNFSKPWEQ